MELPNKAELLLSPIAKISVSLLITLFFFKILQNVSLSKNPFQSNEYFWNQRQK